ncbi:MAG: TolC family protein [Pseudomonadota bacterium]|nr:TolC family protein [Pseudomonadota bacterium]
MMWLLWVVLLKGLEAPAAKIYPPFAEDAKKFIASLPSKSVTIDLVVGLALKNSDKFQQIRALAPTTEIPELNSKIPLEFTTEASFAYTLNRNEPDSAFAATRSELHQGVLGFSKYFASGTGVEMRVTHGHALKELSILGNVALDDNRTSYAELSLSQNLWRDAFGYATRRSLRRGKIESESRRLEIEQYVEEWHLAIVQTYYRAWSAQADVRAAESGLKRREKLLDTTRRKVTSGTAERPDFFQVKSAFVGSKIRLQNSREILDAIWRDLVVTLKFPKHWMNSDPLLVPVALDNPMAPALQLCQQNVKPSSQNSTSVRRSELDKNAAELNFESAKNQVSPQLQLNLIMGSNGVDSIDAGESLNEAFSGTHPNYTAMLALKVPWDNYQAKAQALQAFSQKGTNEAKYKDSISRFEIDWMNQCEQLRHWQEKVTELRDVMNDQRSRLVLEESRFRVGRVPLINLIQAGDDQTDAEVNLARAEVEYRLTSWRIRHLSGLLKSYLDQLGK